MPYPLRPGASSCCHLHGVTLDSCRTAGHAWQECNQLQRDNHSLVQKVLSDTHSLANHHLGARGSSGRR